MLAVTVLSYPVHVHSMSLHDLMLPFVCFILPMLEPRVVRLMGGLCPTFMLLYKDIELDGCARAWPHIDVGVLC